MLVFLCHPVDRTKAHRTLNRFVAVPAPAMEKKLVMQMKELESDVEGMGKRLHYLETTAKNSQEHIEAMLRRGGGQES